MPEARVIPSGEWQRIGAILLGVVGLLAGLASTPFNGAGAVAGFCLPVAGALAFWGVMLKHLSTLEDKLA